MGFTGSVTRISWRTGWLGSSTPARAATRLDQAPAALTTTPAPTRPRGVTTSTTFPFRTTSSVTGVNFSSRTPKRRAARR